MPTVVELRKIASAMGIAGRSKMNKAQLEAAIRTAKKPIAQPLITPLIKPIAKPIPKPLIKPVPKPLIKPSMPMLIKNIAHSIDPSIEYSPSAITILNAVITAFIKKVHAISKSPSVDDIKDVLRGTRSISDGVVMSIKRGAKDETGFNLGDVLGGAVMYILHEMIELSASKASSKKSKSVLPMHLLYIINDDEDLTLFVCKMRPIKGIKC